MGEFGPQGGDLEGSTRFPPGHRLGPYQIDAFIAAGGMGEVYKAHDTRLGRSVAVKRLTSHTDRFQDEARAIAALNHPHICQVYDVGPDYLVLEYIEGSPIQGPLPLDRALTFALQIARALEAAHTRGVLHRDLKPANILVTSAGETKLLDFGLAKLTTSDADMTRTNIGTVLGTAAYMSPEQARGLPVDERSDVFSFGAVLYELVSGRRAFEGGTPAEVVTAVLRDEPQRLQTVESVEGITRRCLEKAPERRFQTMGQLSGALREAVALCESSPAPNLKPSIAVLPFADMSAEKDQEWFGDGLAEEIINALAQLQDLKVSARTSAFAFRGQAQDIRTIARALDVDHVLEGSVRRAGNRLRVSAQLVKASDGYHLWSQRYDREMADVFAIQDEIAASIGDALRVTLGTARATRRPYTASVPAYEAYLKARQCQWAATGGVGPLASWRAKHYYEQALAHDPAFAACHVGLAHHFLVLATYSAMPSDVAMSGMREAAQQALEIDPSLPEAHAMLGLVAGIYDCDWKEAERRFRLAMEQKPIPADVHVWYGVFYLVPSGRAVEAISHHRLALRDDPLNPAFRGALAETFAASGEWEECESVAREIIDFDSSQAWAHLLMAAASAAGGRISDAIIRISRGFEILTADTADPARSVLLEAGADIREALTNGTLGELQPSTRPALAHLIAHYLMLRGAAAEAVEWMTQAIADRHPLAARFLGWSCWKANPRYSGLRRMMNLD